VMLLERQGETLSEKTGTAGNENCFWHLPHS
jgi:hypothetical protein